MAAELSLKPWERDDMMIGEILRSWRMYDIRQNKLWEKFRMLCYYVYYSNRENKQREQPHDMFKLKTDPTPEEMEEMMKEKREEDEKMMQQQYDEVMKFYKDMGLNLN